MTALTQDRNTPEKQGKLVSTPIAANTTIYAGSLVCLNAAGYAVPGSTATGLTYWGMATENKTNTTSNNGQVNINIRRKGMFRWNNSASSDAITQSEVGSKCYVVDDQTVAKTDGSSSRSECGTVVKVDANGVWVEV